MEMECNNYHESKRLFHVIIATDPKNSHALLGLALLEMKQGYNHKAKKIFNELIREYPKDVNAFQAYGIFQGKCKNMKEARELFHHATQLDDVGGQVWHVSKQSSIVCLTTHSPLFSSGVGQSRI